MSRQRRAGGAATGLLTGRLLTGLLAGAAARGAWAALRARPPGGAERWDRVNHRGETLTLLEGPSYAAAAAAAAALAPGVPARLRVAAGLATLGGGFFGAIDDLHESGRSKGLRGHLGELSRGHLTTGGLKVLGIGGTGLLAATLAVPAGDDQNAVRRLNRVVDVLVGGAVIAGSANLLNLFDLRPGRALKVVLLVAPTAAGGPSGRMVAAAAGAAAALLPIDLREQAMLGDTGANAAGALLGTAAAAGLSRRGRVGLLLGLAALTLASERVSFTKVIERTPGLREFDALGRRAPEQAGTSQEPSRRPPG
jgi:UDP-GlcNAc:undecaprenyl-phosphate/decaprenyl-phosphate GlcNAc-1-phosphate transferase